MRNLFNPGDVVVLDFPGVTGVKRRPTVVISSAVYHTSRPDVVVGLITSQTIALVRPTICCRIGCRLACGFPQSFGVFSRRCLPPPILYVLAISRTVMGRVFAPVSGWRLPPWKPRSHRRHRRRRPPDAVGLPNTYEAPC
jgi:hypothetical protein